MKYTDQNDQQILPYGNYVIMRYVITDDDGAQELKEIYGPTTGESIIWALNKIVRLHPVAILKIWSITSL